MREREKTLRGQARGGGGTEGEGQRKRECAIHREPEQRKTKVSLKGQGVFVYIQKFLTPCGDRVMCRAALGTKGIQVTKPSL